MATTPPPDSDDYSAATTIITFPHPVPLLRHPIKASPSDDPSSGPYLLAFKTPRQWSAAYQSCKSQLTSQCESGARIGCSISASSKCKPPWWKLLLGGKQSLSERAKCEEIEMDACFTVAKERCVGFAKDKCQPAFMSARIAVNGSDLGLGDWKEAFRLISGGCGVNKTSLGVGLIDIDRPWSHFRGKYEVTNVTGRDLLGSDDDAQIQDYLRKKQS